MVPLYVLWSLPVRFPANLMRLQRCLVSPVLYPVLDSFLQYLLCHFDPVCRQRAWMPKKIESVLNKIIAATELHVRRASTGLLWYRKFVEVQPPTVFHVRVSPSSRLEPFLFVAIGCRLTVCLFIVEFSEIQSPTKHQVSVDHLP